MGWKMLDHGMGPQKLKCKNVISLTFFDFMVLLTVEAGTNTFDFWNGF